MQGVLQDKYYNTSNLVKYLVQTRCQVKSNGIKLPEVHSIVKRLDPNVQPEKQVIKPVITKVRKVLQIKPSLGQGRTGLRCKIKTPIISPIAKTVDKPLKIPKVPKM